MGCIFGRSKNRKLVVFDRRRRVSVRFGSHVRHLSSRPVMIFIFGGPGSRKGAIIENITSCFGFQHISIGDLVQAEMLRQRPSTVKKFENSRELKTMIEQHDDQYTMTWITERISNRMQDDLNSVYLVDLIPNLKFMMKAKYLTEECRPALTAFDAKFPISFALNLAVPSDRLLQVKDAYLTAASSESGDGKGGMQETGGRGDEADTTKLQKRAGQYEDISKYLINYFTVNNTLVTVDVTGGLTSDIWQRVHQILCELNFRPLRTVGTVVVFEFDESDTVNIDLDKYAMDLIYLENIVRNPQETMENLLKSLSRFIDNSSSRADAFIVRTERTAMSKADLLSQQLTAFRQSTIVSTASTASSHGPLMFTDVGVNYLENYLPGKPRNYVPGSADRQYKSVGSLENEVYLFPLDTPDAICRKIAFLMVQNRAHGFPSSVQVQLPSVESFVAQSPRGTEAEVRPLIHPYKALSSMSDKGSLTMSPMSDKGSLTKATLSKELMSK